VLGRIADIAGPQGQNTEFSDMSLPKRVDLFSGGLRKRARTRNATVDVANVATDANVVLEPKILPEVEGIISPEWLLRLYTNHIKNELTETNRAVKIKRLKGALTHWEFETRQFYWESVAVYCALCAQNTHHSSVDLDSLAWTPEDRLDNNEFQQLFADVVYHGKIHPPEMLCGKVVSELVAREIDKLPTEIIKTATAEEEANLVLILLQCGKNCTFDRTNDRMLHTLIRLMLPAHRDARLFEHETPFKQISELHGFDANKLVRPLINADPASLAPRIVMDETASPTDYATAMGLLLETCDGVALATLINKDITRAIGDKIGGACILNGLGTNVGDVYGVLTADGRLFIQPKQRPVASCVLQWAIEMGLDDLLCGIREPLSLNPSSVFARAFVGM
jgi:hypothetical protein